VADVLHRNPELALEVHTREELGITASSGGGSPRAAATSSFASFAFGAVIPLIPWFFLTGTTAVVVSIMIGAVAALAVGALVAHFTGRSPVTSALRQLAIGAAAAAVTYGIGRVVGVSSA
jgi:VIT1/CCC1 family predicted Fe2+/Mn2+ transporter